MTQEEFWSKLKLYEEQRLRSKGLHMQGTGVPIFRGYSFVYTNRHRVDLMVGGHVLGSAVWRAGSVIFDPLLTLSPKDHSFEDDLERWVSLAQRRCTTGT